MVTSAENPISTISWIGFLAFNISFSWKKKYNSP